MVATVMVEVVAAEQEIISTDKLLDKAGPVGELILEMAKMLGVVMALEEMVRESLMLIHVNDVNKFA